LALINKTADVLNITKPAFAQRSLSTEKTTPCDQRTISIYMRYHDGFLRYCLQNGLFFIINETIASTKDSDWDLNQMHKEIKRNYFNHSVI